MNEMNCDHVIDYLNGTLTAEEMEEFQLHLNNCEECRELVEAVGELPYLAEATEPPAGMKARILANVFDDSQQEAEPIKKQEPTIEAQQTTSKQESKVVPMVKPPKQQTWWRPMIAAVLLLSLLGNAYAFMKLSDEGGGGGQTESAFQSIDLQASEGFGGNAKAALVRDGESLEVVVQADQLQELTGTEVYQIWLLKDGKPIPAGAFETDADGKGAAYYQLAANTEEWDTIAITLEPEAGNELPEGEIVLSAGI